MVGAAAIRGGVPARRGSSRYLTTMESCGYGIVVIAPRPCRSRCVHPRRSESRVDSLGRPTARNLGGMMKRIGLVLCFVSLVVCSSVAMAHIGQVEIAQQSKFDQFVTGLSLVNPTHGPVLAAQYRTAFEKIQRQDIDGFLASMINFRDVAHQLTSAERAQIDAMLAANRTPSVGIEADCSANCTFTSCNVSNCDGSVSCYCFFGFAICGCYCSPTKAAPAAANLDILTLDDLDRIEAVSPQMHLMASACPPDQHTLPATTPLVAGLIALLLMATTFVVLKRRTA